MKLVTLSAISTIIMGIVFGTILFYLYKYVVGF